MRASLDGGSAWSFNQGFTILTMIEIVSLVNGQETGGKLSRLLEQLQLQGHVHALQNVPCQIRNRRDEG